MPDCDHDCCSCALNCADREGGKPEIQKLEQNEGSNSVRYGRQKVRARGYRYSAWEE